MTEAEIDDVKPSRRLDVMIESKLMGRKVTLKKGEPCAWDNEGKVIMHGVDDYILEDYSPAVDGTPVPGSGFNPKVVFNYSYHDLGMVRVMDRVMGSTGLHEFLLSWNSAAPGWVASIKWFDADKSAVRLVRGHDPNHARLAVYRAALKAALT